MNSAIPFLVRASSKNVMHEIMCSWLSLLLTHSYMSQCSCKKITSRDDIIIIISNKTTKTFNYLIKCVQLYLIHLSTVTRKKYTTLKFEKFKHGRSELDELRSDVNSIHPVWTLVTYIQVIQVYLHLLLSSYRSCYANTAEPKCCWHDFSNKQPANKDDSHVN